MSLKQHHNNFGFLRLLLATLVIISHSPEIIDGNRSREILTQLFGTLSFGEVAVDGFFIISGYLIVKSFENSSSTIGYFDKRVRRIFPGFLVSFLVCVFVIGPFVGLNLHILSYKDFLKLGVRAVMLNGTDLPAFVGLPYPNLNGSLWSISIEFRCYLLVVVLALAGLYKRRIAISLITAALLIMTALKFRPVIPGTATLVGDPFLLIRCFGAFCVGSCFYVFRGSIPYNGKIASAAAAFLVAGMFVPVLAESCFLVLGGYLIFWLALSVRSVVLSAINGKDDISYGVYLYAWPIQSLLVYFFQLESPFLLSVIALPITYLIAYLSWRFVESPFLLKRPKFAEGSSRV
jgi:peptidoglycan/LPS O-acetylase OafA/YrhL